MRAQPGQARQFLLRRAAVGHRFGGVFVTQFIQGKAAAFSQFCRAGHGIRVSGEQAGHFRRGFQMPFGIGGEAKASPSQSAMFPDTAQHILQGPPAGTVIMHIVSCHQGRIRVRRQPGKPGQSAVVIAGIKVMPGQVTTARPALAQFLCLIGEGRILFLRR